jgi:hypothetical protein
MQYENIFVTYKWWYLKYLFFFQPELMMADHEFKFFDINQ